MMINIKDVLSVSGMPGLYLVVKQDDKSIIVEAMDETKRRQLLKGNIMASKLTDISIYTEGDESEGLLNLLKNIRQKYGNKLPVSKNDPNNALMGFLADVLPNYNREKVYASNVKKLVAWYEILAKNNVDFEIPEENTAPPVEESAAQEQEVAPKKTTKTSKKTEVVAEKTEEAKPKTKTTKPKTEEEKTEKKPAKPKKKAE